MMLFLHVKDYSTGFGGKFGVQKDRQDKSAHTWEERDALAKHESQKGDGLHFNFPRNMQLTYKEIKKCFIFLIVASVCPKKMC